MVAGTGFAGRAVAWALPSSEAACARVVRLRCSRAQRPFEGTRTPRSAPRVVDPAAAGAAPTADGRRPAVTGGAESGDTSAFVARVLHHARDSAALAPANRCVALDVPAQAAGPASRRPGGTSADPAARAGERYWGYVRIVGELRKLGITVSATLVRNVLRRHPSRTGARPLGVGDRFCVNTETRSLRATSSLSTRSGCDVCTSSSSFRSGRAGSNTSPVRASRTRPG